MAAFCVVDGRMSADEDTREAALAWLGEAREARDDDECGRFLEVNMLSHGDDDDSDDDDDDDDGDEDADEDE